MDVVRQRKYCRQSNTESGGANNYGNDRKLFSKPSARAQAGASFPQAIPKLEDRRVTTASRQQWQLVYSVMSIRDIETMQASTEQS